MKKPSSNYSRVFTLLLLLVLASCSYLLPDPTSGNKSESYYVNFENEKWEEVDPQGSDLVFSHPASGSLMLINSLCHKYESTPLKYLQENLLLGIDDIEIRQSKTVRYSSRKALRSHATGKLDGVRIYALIQIVRKNHCVYDFVLISKSQENYRKLQPDFNELLNSIEIN